jgi:putative oxidoreductase
MPLSDSFIATWQPRVLALLRIAAAFLFMAHGLQKILGFPVPPHPKRFSFRYRALRA